MSYATKRIGVPTLVRLSTVLCFALGKFAVPILRKFPNNTALAVAIAAAQVACLELRKQLDGVRDIGD